MHAIIIALARPRNVSDNIAKLDVNFANLYVWNESSSQYDAIGLACSADAVGAITFTRMLGANSRF